MFLFELYLDWKKEWAKRKGSAGLKIMRTMTMIPHSCQTEDTFILFRFFLLLSFLFYFILFAKNITRKPSTNYMKDISTHLSCIRKGNKYIHTKTKLKKRKKISNFIALYLKVTKRKKGRTNTSTWDIEYNKGHINIKYIATYRWL